MSDFKGPWFDAGDAGLADFFAVYDQHYDEILAGTMEQAASHPDFGPMLRALSPDALAAQNRESRERLRRAVAGQWQDYERQLRTQGAAYATSGFSFAGWYDLIGIFKRIMVPLLTRVYAGAPERLALALGAMLRFVDRTMIAIGEEYLDTKERLVAEQRERVREREEVLDYLVDGVNLFDRQGRYLFANPSSERTQKKSLPELLGKVFWEVHPDAVGNPFYQAFQRVAAGGGYEQFEFHHAKWNRWLEVQMYPVRSGVLSITRDITERRLSEQAGRFFALALDLLCIAGTDGYFKRINPAFKALGWSEEELLSRPFVDFVHEDDRAATLAEVEKLARGQQSVAFENRYRCKDGSYRDLLWVAAPEPSGFIYAAARDITERKRAEAERARLNALLTRQNEELTRASQAKSDFLAMMSHELRTPLNSIIGFSEILIDGKFGAINDKQRRYLTNVHQSGRHLLGLINDLLDLSKIEAGRLEVVRQPCAARTAAAEAVATLTPLADSKGVRVVHDRGGGEPLPPVSADVARLKQVLYNLISNAIKFTDAGGRVEVSSARAARPGFLRISVRDTGTGIAAEDQARLFRPFTQLGNAKDRGGTGLGLSLTRQLVELMGGQIGVASKLGEGSTFWIELPIHTAPAPAAGPSGAVPSTAPLALVVDDDPTAQELLALALHDAGFRTVTVASGDEAIAEARKLRPDVITLDVFLPTIDGWDVLRLLKSDATTASIPVVMVTISSDRGKAFSLGALEHLIKPVQRDALLGALERRSFTTKVKDGPVHVLAVDDDEAQLELFRATLEPHGFRVQTVTTGRAGIEAARSGVVNLILLDLVMPDISGIEVVSALRGDERTRAIPILLVTAHELTAAQRARVNGDVEAILSKGATQMDDLLREVRRVVRDGAH